MKVADEIQQSKIYGKASVQLSQWEKGVAGEGHNTVLKWKGIWRRY